MPTRDAAPPDNPYAPPEETVGRWRAREAEPELTTSSGVPKVFGVLSVTFASILLLFGLLGSCSGLSGRSMLSVTKKLPARGKKAERARRMLAQLAEFYFWTGIENLVLAAMSGGLLAIGIGQLRYRRWAQRWTVRWSIVALVVVGGLMLLALLVLGPAYEKIFRSAAETHEVAASGMSAASSLASVMLGVLQAALLSPYPILLLIFFSRPRVRAAMNR